VAFAFLFFWIARAAQFVKGIEKTSTKACVLLPSSSDDGIKCTPFSFLLKEERIMTTVEIVDTLWVLLAAVLVFFMNLGFAAVESGMARSKNTVNILSKNFIVFAISSLGFMLLGWGLMFGGDNPMVGTQHLFILDSSNIGFYEDTLTSNVPFWGKFFFQLVFCGTAATIVSRAVAERIKYISFIVFSFILTLFIYPIVGHWIWEGDGLRIWDSWTLRATPLSTRWAAGRPFPAPSYSAPATGNMTEREAEGHPRPQ
jgi:hypothetical protein